MSDQYTTGAFCTNCGYEGPVVVDVGIEVYSAPCPLCCTKMLRAVALRDWEERIQDRGPVE